MTGIDPGAAAVLLILGACVGVELTRITIDWNNDLRPGGTMRNLTALIITFALAGGLVAAAAHPATCEPGEERVFADVSADHLFCAEIEELWRRGTTSGCGEGNYCPETAVTRGQFAHFVVDSTPRIQPFARVSYNGTLLNPSDGVIHSLRLQRGQYAVMTERATSGCVFVAQAYDAPGTIVSVGVEGGDPPSGVGGVVMVHVRDGELLPFDASFDLISRCIEIPALRSGEPWSWATHTSPDAD